MGWHYVLIMTQYLYTFSWKRMKKIINLTVFSNLHIKLNCSLNQSPSKLFRVILKLADNVELTLLYSEELKTFLWNNFKTKFTEKAV